MNVVVVGGGVAGAASAIALRRVGAEVTVYEAYRDPAGPVGSFLSLAANGLRGLDVLGCLAAVQRAGFPVARQRMWAGNGKRLGDVARGRRADDPLQSVTLMRADLVAALRDEATRSGAVIRTGERPISAGDDRLAGADLVVGADGIWSATRRALDPAAPEPRYAGIYHVSGTAEGLELETGAFNMIFARRGAFIYLPAPDGTVWWSAQVAAAEPPDLATVEVGDLMRIFGSEERAVAILRASAVTHAATLSHVLDEVRHTHDDRIVLIGDAAHPVGAGQGASMAIEDAVILAREVHRADGIPQALAGYQELRGARLGKMARTATTNRDAKTAGPVAARLRNLFMPLFFNRFYEKATGWLYDYDLGALPAVSGQQV
jgi:salicylate hydroxylase